MSRQRSFAVAVIRSLVVGGALVAFLGGPAARATETESALPSSRSWYAGIATGWYFPIERPSSPYSLGGGGVLLLGHQLSSRLSLRLEINMSLLGGDPHDTWSLRVTPEIKWDLFGERLTPFLWSGAGLAHAAVYPGRSRPRHWSSPSGWASRGRAEEEVARGRLSARGATTGDASSSRR